MSAAHNFEEIAKTAALYAVGELPEPEARKFEQRIQSGCPLCMAELGGCQRAVEGMVLAAAPLTPDRSLEARLFEKIGRAPVAPGILEPKIVRSDEGDWVDGTPGIKYKLLHRKRTMLVKMEPGAHYPSHAHALDEQCLVVEGTIQQADGVTASAGDFVFMPKGSTHPPLYSETGALFLIAYT